MASPYFFEKNIPDSDEFILSEETSRHASQVLRMKAGEEIIITNGKGYTIKAHILFADKKKTQIKVSARKFLERPSPKNAIAISLIKNHHRFEWFVEKATEIGIPTIIPLLCHRTEKTQFKNERINSILISAMLQSQQSWLPELAEPSQFSEIMEIENYDQKFIAHCIEDDKKELTDVIIRGVSKIILIGPEGDFTEKEIQSATEHDFVPVSLAPTRLRTETAAMVAAVLINQK